MLASMQDTAGRDMLVSHALAEFAQIIDERAYRNTYGEDGREALRRDPALLMRRFTELHRALFNVEFGDRVQPNSLDAAFHRSPAFDASAPQVEAVLGHLAARLARSDDPYAKATLLAEAFAGVYAHTPFGPEGTMIVLDALFCELAEMGLVSYDLRNLGEAQLAERRALLSGGAYEQSLPALTRLFEQAGVPYQAPEERAPDPLPYRLSKEEMGENFEAIATRRLPGETISVAFRDGTFRMLSITDPEIHVRGDDGNWSHSVRRGTYVVLADGGLVAEGDFRALAAGYASPAELKVPRGRIADHLMHGPVPAGLLLNPPAGAGPVRFEDRREVDGISLRDGVPAISLDVDFFTNLRLGKKGELDTLKAALKAYGTRECEGRAACCEAIMASLYRHLPPLADGQRYQAVWEALTAPASPLRDNLMMLMLAEPEFAETVARDLPESAPLIARAHERLRATGPVLWKEFTLQMNRGQLGEELKGERRTEDGKPLFVITAGPSAAGKTTSIEAMTFLLGANPDVPGSKELFNQAYVFSGLDRGRQLLDVHTQVRGWVDGDHDYPDTTYIGDISRNVLLELAKCCRFNVVRDGSGVPSYKTEEMIKQVRSMQAFNQDGCAYQELLFAAFAPLLGKTGSLGTLQRSALRFLQRCEDGSYVVKGPFNPRFQNLINESDPDILADTARRQGVAVPQEALNGVYDPLRGLDPAMGLPQRVPIDKNLSVAREFDELARAANHLVGIDNSGAPGTSHAAILTGLTVTGPEYEALQKARADGTLMEAFRQLNLMPWRSAHPKPGESREAFEARAHQVFFGNIDMGTVTQDFVTALRSGPDGSRRISAVYDVDAMRLVMDQGQYRQAESSHALRVTRMGAGAAHGLTA